MKLNIQVLSNIFLSTGRVNSLYETPLLPFNFSKETKEGLSGGATRWEAGGRQQGPQRSAGRGCPEITHRTPRRQRRHQVVFSLEIPTVSTALF